MSVMRGDPKVKAPKFVVYPSKYRGITRWRWTCYARNGKIIADGGEDYSAPGKAKQGIKSLKSPLPVDDSLTKVKKVAKKKPSKKPAKKKPAPKKPKKY